MIAFIHIHKTAGTNLKYILRRSFGATHCDVRMWPKNTLDEREQLRRVVSARDIRRTRWVYWNLKSIAGHSVTGHSDIKELDGIRFYTFLREPDSRLVSHYQFMLRDGTFYEPFDEWVKKDRYRNLQCQMLCGEQNAQKAIDFLKSKQAFVGLQERFDESLLLLKKWANERRLDVRYRSLNVAKDKKVANDLMEQATYREWIADANREDAKLYQYVTEVIYPRQLAEYGENLPQDLGRFLEEIKTYDKHKPFRGKITRGFYWLLLPLISTGKVF